MASKTRTINTRLSNKKQKSVNMQLGEPQVLPPTQSAPIVSEMWSKTTSIEHKVIFKWQIENFSTYYCSDSNDYSFITSDKFSPLTNSKLQFNLKLYPKGDRDDAKDYISLYLCLIDASELPRTKYSFSILKANGEKFKTWFAASKFASSGFGFSKLLLYSIVNNMENGLLPRDTLTIACEVSAYTGQLNISGSKVSSDAIKLAESEFTQNFASLLTSATPVVPTDIVLRVGGKDIAAHKFILMIRSPVFAAMFQHNLNEIRLNMVNIPDITVSVFEEFLRFVYTGKVNLDKVTIELLVAADKYQLGTLKSICEHSLGSRLEVDSVMKAFLLADMHGAHHLKAQCIEFINKNSGQIISSEGWKHLCSYRPELVIQLYQSFTKSPSIDTNGIIDNIYIN